MKNDIDDFLVYLLSEKGFSKHTIDAYRRDIQQFYLSINHQFSDWKEVQMEQIIQFLTQKRMKNYATASIARAMIAIKVFFRFLKREGIISENVCALLETPKVWQVIPDVLSLEEVERIVVIPDPTTQIGARDRAILELLYASGLRVSELCQMTIADVDDHFLLVQGKGGKQRTVPIGKKAIEAIDHYLSFREGNEPNRQEYLFLGKNGRMMHRTSIWRLVRMYAVKAGITKPIHPHTFRHSFATHLLDNGADVRIIQEMMGHASISSTDRYTHVSIPKLKESFDRFHPRK